MKRLARSFAFSLGLKLSGSIEVQKGISVMRFAVKCCLLLVGVLVTGVSLAQSVYVPVTPARVVDTRLSGLTIDGQYQASGPVAVATVFNVNIAGRAGVPASGVTAVAMNVTITDPSGAGNVTVYPAGTAKPAPANVNFAAGQSYSGQVIVPLGTSGQVSFYIDIGSPSATANIVADLVGYVPTGSNYTPLTPVRFVDTRLGASTVDGLYAGGGGMASGETRVVKVGGRSGVPAGVSSVLISMTGAGSAGAGIFTAWQEGPLPPLGMINFTAAGQTRTNLVLVGVAADGTVSFNDGVPGGTTDLIVNVFGYFSSTPTFSKVTPARLLDTRAGMPTVDGQYAAIGQLASNATVNLTVMGRGGVPSTGVGAVALNVVAINPAAQGFITAWSTGFPNSPPNAMQVNFGAGQTVPSLVIAKVGSNGQVSLNNNSASVTDMTVSVEGWFPSTSNPPPPSPTITSGVSTGDDGYTVHLKGANFQVNSSVDVRAGCGGDVIQSYSGSSIRVMDSSNIYITITDPSQRSLFASSGEYFWVVNPTPTGTWSSCQFVQWASPPSPQLLSGNTSGVDSYTIHLSGQYFHSNSYVDVYAYYGGPVIASYSGSQISVTNDSDISFYISDATQRSYLNSSGLLFWVVNPTPSPAWDGPVTITRIEPNTSYYDSLSSAVSVSGTQTVLQRTFTLTTPTWILFSTDGSVKPLTNSGITYTSSITLDGAAISNPSAISWVGTNSYDTHSFNNIAAQYVQPGTHVAKLVATTTGAGVSISASTNLSVMLSPATTVIDSVSGSDVGPINFNTYSSAVGNNDRSPNPDPHQYLPVTSATISVPSGQPLVLLGSGTHYQAGHDGDSAIGFWLDGTQSTSLQSTWAFNDICACAELKAPFFLHGLYPSLSVGSHQAVLGGGEFYWSDQGMDNPIIYKISAGSHLIGLSGGIQTSGVLYSPVGFPNAITSMLNSIPVSVSSPQTMASGTINVPGTSSGVVYMTAKTRIFGGSGNETVSLRIMVDGNYVGSIGTQTCGYQNSTSGCVSGRTLTASYLAAGPNKLSVGAHTVQVIASVQSTNPSQGLFATDDAPFIWFD